MDRARDAVARFVSGRALIPIAVLLVALRFAAPTAIAGLGVTGIDTRPVDSAFSAYAGVLPAILVVLVVFVVWAWPGSFPRSRAAWLTAFLVSVTAILWLGQADARLRLYASPWSGLALGAFAAAALGGWLMALGRSLPDRGGRDVRRSGLRALGLGFAGAFLLSSLRLVDYGYELGTPLPPGLVWFLDYSPTLLLSFLAVGYWVELVLLRAKLPVEATWTIGPVAAIAIVGLALSQGFGGFLMSNALTWGGGYAVFAPTSASLTIVGTGVGGFVSIALRLRTTMDRRHWRFLVGGVLTAAFSGITPFGGVLPSLSGILLGVTLAARGLVPEGSAGPAVGRAVRDADE